MFKLPLSADADREEMLQLHRKKTGDTSYASFYAESDDRSKKEEDMETIGVGPLWQA